MPKRAANEQYQDDVASSPSKKRRLFEAAKQNDVETLKHLLDSSQWYKNFNKDGQNLLHLAVVEEKNEVFDYLLSLGDFPLDVATANKRRLTALQLALRDTFFSVKADEHYAIELIKHGARINVTCYDGGSPLHVAVARGSLKLVQLLIERGADVNRLNNLHLTPLQMVKSMYEHTILEIIAMLLCNGADPSVRDTFNHTIFDHLILNEGDSSLFCTGDRLVVLENLFYFTVDEWSSYSVYVEGLLRLARCKSPLFHLILKFTSENSEVIFGEDISRYCLYPFIIDCEYLRVLLEKHPNAVKGCLQHRYSDEILTFATFRLENFEMLLQSSLRSDTLELISTLNVSSLISRARVLGKKIGEILEMIYYLLSYGLVLDRRDVENIYELTGYSDDFKNILFMDMPTNKKALRNIKTMPRLLYDIRLDIHKIVETPDLCDFIDWEQIFHYFIHPKIQNAYRQLKPYEASKRDFPHQLPLLKELARDAFRKYFIKRLNITNTCQFYTLLKALPINKHVEIVICTTSFESNSFFHEFFSLIKEGGAKRSPS